MPASAATQQELGVVRWTRNLPSSIDGVDADGNVVVSLQRDAREANGETQYAVRLREQDNESRTQIALGKNAFGSDTLFARERCSTPRGSMRVGCSDGWTRTFAVPARR